MTQFKIYHIDYSTLLTLANTTTVEPSDAQMREYTEKVVSMFKCLSEKNDLRTSDNKSHQWHKIALSANWLFDHNWYDLVGTVSADNALEAVRSVTNIDGFWFMNKNVTVNKVSSRNTSSLDIIEVEGNNYLVVTGGFYDLATFKFISNHQIDYADEC